MSDYLYWQYIVSPQIMILNQETALYNYICNLPMVERDILNLALCSIFSSMWAPYKGERR